MNKFEVYLSLPYPGDKGESFISRLKTSEVKTKNPGYTNLFHKRWKTKSQQTDGQLPAQTACITWRHLRFIWRKKERRRCSHSIINSINRHDCENSKKGWKIGMRAKQAGFGAEPQENFELWSSKTSKSFNLTSFQNPPRSR